MRLNRREWTLALSKGMVINSALIIGKADCVGEGLAGLSILIISLLILGIAEESGKGDK